MSKHVSNFLIKILTISKDINFLFFFIFFFFVEIFNYKLHTFFFSNREKDIFYIKILKKKKSRFIYVRF